MSDHHDYSEPIQAPRTPIEVSGIEAMVCKDIADRQRLGINKYGTTVMDSNEIGLKPWLVHAYQECLDQAVYLRRAIEELER